MTEQQAGCEGEDTGPSADCCCPGLTSWTAGEHLATWLDTRPHLLQGRRVVELGAGAGLTGIFALRRWGDIARYVFTDCHAKVLDNLRSNM